MQKESNELRIWAAHITKIGPTRYLLRKNTPTTSKIVLFNKFNSNQNNL